ncbi:MAG TPA: SAM-dependent methyltransferase [Candidatus Polarisedimenticolia bacterium]
MAVARQVEAGADLLRAWLRDRIRAEGPIPFVEFMEGALYHPEHGYYLRPEMTTGPDGDFYTSPDLHPAFGLLIARQIAEIAAVTRPDARAPFHVVEMGPGTGRLARDVIAGLAAEHPLLASRVVYTLVEISPSLRVKQRGTIAAGRDSGALSDLRWRSWPDLLEEERAGLAGCVVANEFLDALPVHVVERRDGRLQEVHVTEGPAGFTETLLEPVAEVLSGHLTRLGVDLREGQRAEIGLRALEWISSLGRLFGERGRGGAIIIDYGYPAGDLYAAERRRGTLMCYRSHQAVEDPYRDVGEQDMTAHVDFTSVERRARECGFDVAGPVAQMRFLVSLGLARILAEMALEPGEGASAVKERLALHGLMAPGGMGEIFKVMLLTRGAKAAELTGARDPFR